jgi:hypothetical protein
MIWERGQVQSWLERTLALLAFASPDTAPEQLAGLSLGQRDRLLFTLQAQTFGPVLESYQECPGCAERLEFSLSIAEILAAAPPALAAGPESGTEEPPGPVAELGGCRVSFRLPDSRDLAAIAAYPDVESARRELVRRCLTAIQPPLASDELPAELLAGLAEEILRRDPLADLTLDLSCPTCGQRWQVALDIGAFLWAEINHRAKRLLREVHALANAYGWRESDILALSAARRQAYLELAL